MEVWWEAHSEFVGGVGGCVQSCHNSLIPRSSNVLISLALRLHSVGLAKSVVIFPSIESQQHGKS